MLYLNNAGTTWPKPTVVDEAVATALARPPWSAAAQVEEDRGTLARLLGISDPERLLVTASCTSALALALGEMPWAPNDRLLTSHLEHHALARWATRLERDREVEVARSPYGFGAPLDLDWLRRQLGRGGVRAVAITAAANTTGELLPVGEAVALAHEYGAMAVVDGAQVAGVHPVDLAELGADVFTVAGHKGPLGPQGVGLLYVAPSVELASPAATCDIGGATPSCGGMLSWCDVGSVPAAGLAGLVAGWTWCDGDEGRAAWAQACRAAAELAQRVHDTRRMRVLGGVDVPRTATLAVELEGVELSTLEARCAAADVIVRVGSHCAPWALEALGRPRGVLRISFGPFCDVDAVDRVHRVLASLGS